MERGLVGCLVSLVILYPILFAFGMNKYTFALLMYLVVMSSAISSYLSRRGRLKKGKYRVVYSQGVFEDYLEGENSDFFIFRSHAIRKSTAELLERVEEGKKESGLHEYFH